METVQNLLTFTNIHLKVESISIIAITGFTAVVAPNSQGAEFQNGVCEVQIVLLYHVLYDCSIERGAGYGDTISEPGNVW